MSEEIFNIDDHWHDGIGVNQELSKNLGLKVQSHRNQAYSIFRAHYYEILINQRNYLNLPTTINKYKMEHFLRYGYDVAIGLDKYGVTRLLGYVVNRFTDSDPASLYAYSPVTKNDIVFIIPKENLPETMSELNANNSLGNFIVLRNKPVSYVSDFKIVDMYARKYAEIEASYFSLIIQAKVSTIIQTNVNDETANQQIEALYNGNPYMKLSNLMRPDREIFSIDNTNLYEKLKSIRDAENDVIAQLNNYIAINGTGANKQSGVSDDEVHANDQQVNATGNIYINGIQEPLTRWNKIYGTKYFVYLNQVPTQDDNKEDNHENDDNDNGHYTE